MRYVKIDAITSEQELFLQDFQNIDKIETSSLTKHQLEMAILLEDLGLLNAHHKPKTVYNLYWGDFEEEPSSIRLSFSLSEKGKAFLVSSRFDSPNQL